MVQRGQIDVTCHTMTVIHEGDGVRSGSTASDSSMNQLRVVFVYATRAPQLQHKAPRL